MRTMDFYNYRVGDMKAKLQHMGVRPLDVMMAGVTGAGKIYDAQCVLSEDCCKSWRRSGSGDHGSGRIYA